MRGVFREVVGVDEGFRNEAGKPRGGGLQIGTISKTFPGRLHHRPSPAIAAVFPRLVNLSHLINRTCTRPVHLYFFVSFH